MKSQLYLHCLSRSKLIRQMHHYRCTATLRALPIYLECTFLCKFTTAFLISWAFTNYCQVPPAEQMDEPDLSDVAVALPTVSCDVESFVKFSPAWSSIVHEDSIVMSDLLGWAEAFLLMFGLMYALDVWVICTKCTQYISTICQPPAWAWMILTHYHLHC